MKLTTTTTAAILSLGAMSAANATLLAWQTEVGSGTAAASTLFSVVNGAAPQEHDVGSLTGARTFEFIVNAGDGGVSSALLGDAIVGGPRQALKFEQYNNAGVYGVTSFGVADFSSFAPITTGTDVHLAFVFDGSDTHIYENGVLADTLFATALTLTDTVGIGGIRNTAGPATYFDNMDGDILGFASYDSALSGAEVLAHSNAFAIVPEPSSTALLGLGGLALILRRRKG